MRVIVVIDESDHMRPRVYAGIAALLRGLAHDGIHFNPSDRSTLIENLAHGKSWADKTTYFGWHTVEERE